MSEQSPELRQAVERVEEIAKSKKWISAMRGEGNGPGGQYDCVLMDERFTACLAAALRLATAEGAMAQWTVVEAPNVVKAELTAARAACEAQDG